jgi:hypothetical protein
MDDLVLYINNENGLSILVPCPEALEKYTIHEIAQKDVPAGHPYKIFKRTDLPLDSLDLFSAWEIDLDELNDGVGGEQYTFLEDR